jgi:arylformamidase
MLIDISPVLEPRLPGWPGDTPFTIERVVKIGPGCPVNVSNIVTSSQIGSHADAPLHYKQDGASIADLPLEPFIGRCIVVDARQAKDRTIREADVVPPLPEKVERILIRQYERYPTEWDPDLKGLDPAFVTSLARRGVRLIGVDAASVDPADSKTLDAHHEIDRHDIRIVEGLVLDRVEPGEYELIALPIKIANSDGAPLRAVLRSIAR